MNQEKITKWKKEWESNPEYYLNLLVKQYYPTLTIERSVKSSSTWLIKGEAKDIISIVEMRGGYYRLVQDIKNKLGSFNENTNKQIKKSTFKHLFGLNEEFEISIKYDHVVIFKNRKVFHFKETEEDKEIYWQLESGWRNPFSAPHSSHKQTYRYVKSDLTEVINNIIKEEDRIDSLYKAVKDIMKLGKV